MADKLKIFVSSPGDVGQERLISTRVIERLNGEFSRYFEIMPYLWEHEPLKASAHFQEQITLPSQTNIVVFILWSRLGTRLPDNIKRPDGTPYSSGTEFEFENALDAFKSTGLPDILVYRKIQDPNLSISNESVMMEKLEQKRALDSFVDKWFGSSTTGFKAAFHAFKSADEFENILEEHLRRLIRDKIPEIPVSIPVKRWYQNPFRGLEAFEFEHAPVFFGRTKAISEMIQKLTPASDSDLPFVMVYGMSGCGKSSLVKAGVIPTLTQPGVIEGIGIWRRASFRPGDSPSSLVAGLFKALTEEKALPELISEPFTDGSLENMIRTAPHKAVDAILKALDLVSEAEYRKNNLTKKPETRLVLLIDQLEELFTFQQITQDDRELLIHILYALAESRKVWIIATMRSDFYHKCADLPELIRLSENNEYRLMNPEFTEIGQIIRNPAFAAGLSFEVNPDTGERLDDIIHYAASKDTASLPLLEFTLTELFKQRITKNTGEEILTISAYNSLGGLEGALAKRAEDVYMSLPSDVKSVFPSIFRALVTADMHGESIITNARVSYELVALTDKHRALLDAFIRERLIVSDRDTQGKTVVRIAHEAMLGCWPRLKELLSEAVDFLRIRKHLTDSATLWEQETKKKDFLLQRGKPMAEAMDAFKKYRNELSPLVVEYIRESAKKARKAKFYRYLTVAAAFVLISAFSIITYIQLQEVSKQRQIALEGQIELLVSASGNALTNGDRLGAINTGLEAYNKLKEGKPNELLASKTQVALYKTLYAPPLSSFGVLKGHYASVNKIIYSPNNAYIMTLSQDRTIKIWDAAKFEEIFTIDPQWDYLEEYASFSNDGSLVMVGSTVNNQILVYQTKTGKKVSDFELQIGAAPSSAYFSFLPDGKRIFSFRGDYKQIYDLKGNLLKELPIKGPTEEETLLSPDGKVYASSMINGNIYISVLESGEFIKELPDSAMFKNFAFSQDSKYFTASWGSEVKVWDTSDWSLLYTIEPPKNPAGDVVSLKINTEKKTLLAGYSEYGACLYDLETGKLKLVCPTSSGNLSASDLSIDGNILYTVSNNIDIWDTEKGSKAGTLSFNGSTPYGTAMSNDSSFIVCGLLEENNARIFSLKGSSIFENTESFDGQIVHQVTTPNYYSDQEAEDAPELYGEHVYAQEVYATGPMFVVSPDHRYIAMVYPDGYIELFDTKKKTDGKVLPTVTFSNHTNPINCAYFSFDSRLLLTGSYDNKAIIYDVESKKMLFELKGHTQPIRAAEFSRDNKLVFTWSADNTVRLWSTETGKELGLVYSGDKLLSDVGFDPEYKNLVLVKEDGSAIKVRIIKSLEGLVEQCRKLVKGQ